MEEISTRKDAAEFSVQYYFFCYQDAIYVEIFSFFLMLTASNHKRITHCCWWTLKCFRFYMIIHHSMKPKYKTSIKLLMAATKIKLESCSLVAPRRDCSTDTEREQDGWLHWHVVKARLAILGNRFSLLCDTHRFSSSVTTAANQGPGNVRGLWQYLLTLKTHWLHRKTPSDTK